MQLNGRTVPVLSVVTVAAAVPCESRCGSPITSMSGDREARLDAWASTSLAFTIHNVYDLQGGSHGQHDSLRDTHALNFNSYRGFVS